MDERKLFSELQHFLLKMVKPNANYIDDNFDLLRDIFNQFQNKKFFRVYIPAENNGIPLSKPGKILFEEMLGGCSGALSFLQAQSATAARLSH